MAKRAIWHQQRQCNHQHQRRHAGEMKRKKKKKEIKRISMARIKEMAWQRQIIAGNKWREMAAKSSHVASAKRDEHGKRS